MSDKKRLLNDLRVIDLRAELEKRNLDKSGVRGVLIQRLSKHLEEEGLDPATYKFELASSDGKTPSKKTRRSESTVEQEADDTPAMEDMIVQDDAGDDDETEQKENNAETTEAKMEVEETEKTARKRELHDDSEASEPKKACLDKEAKEEDQKTDNNDAEDSINLDLGEDELLNEETDNTTKPIKKDEAANGDEEAQSEAAAGGDAAPAGDAAPPATSHASADQPATSNDADENDQEQKDDKDKEGEGDKKDRKDESKEGGARNLWVSGLSGDTRAKDLKQLCSKHGKVIGAKVVTNAKTPGSRCYGYVTMATSQDAENCIKNLHRTELHGRMISVEKAKSESESSSRRQPSRSDHGKECKEESKEEGKDGAEKTGDGKPSESGGEGTRSTSRTREKSDRSDKVLVALSFYATGSYQRPTGDISSHAIAQPTVSTVIRQITNLLNLPHMREKYIKFPRTQEERRTNIIRFHNKFGMPGVLGCIDCSHIAIIRPIENEERYYCRKQYHSLNVQLDRAKRSTRSRERRRSPPRDVLSFNKIWKERDVARARERSRAAREEERRRRAAEEVLRERERRQRQEKHRLAVEREKLRAEREKIEREKNELLRLERERHRLEREKLELERMELKRAQLRLEDERRKRGYESSSYRKAASPPPDPAYERDARHKRPPPPPIASTRQFEAPPPPRFEMNSNYDRSTDKRDRGTERDYKRSEYPRHVSSANIKYSSNGATDDARQPMPPGTRPKEPSRTYDSRDTRSYRPSPPTKPEPRSWNTSSRYPDSSAPSKGSSSNAAGETWSSSGGGGGGNSDTRYAGYDTRYPPQYQPPPPGATYPDRYAQPARESYTRKY